MTVLGPALSQWRVRLWQTMSLQLAQGRNSRLRSRAASGPRHGPISALADARGQGGLFCVALRTSGIDSSQCPNCSQVAAWLPMRWGACLYRDSRVSSMVSICLHRTPVRPPTSWNLVLCCLCQQSCLHLFPPSGSSRLHSSRNRRVPCALDGISIADLGMDASSSFSPSTDHHHQWARRHTVEPPPLAQAVGSQPPAFRQCANSRVSVQPSPILMPSPSPVFPRWATDNHWPVTAPRLPSNTRSCGLPALPIFLDFRGPLSPLFLACVLPLLDPELRPCDPGNGRGASPNWAAQPRQA